MITAVSVQVVFGYLNMI